jgi:hypothetical protein
LNFKGYSRAGLQGGLGVISKMFLECTNLVIKKRKLLLKGVLLIPVLLWASGAYAQRVLLQWDRNSEDDLAGYVVYYGTRHGHYQWQEDIGLQGCGVRKCTTTLDLAKEQRWYISVTAYDVDGYESRYSSEVVANLAPTKTLAWLDLLLGEE